ncbi:hypothetical protein CBR_g34278 [Chara braunii]|uniref:At3g05675-like ankyrin-like domain-containing protein n=1 Tax=Chara braunii TaxID=69332 RepID=A0A388JYP8_CHABU|nr:hypothetical protein CBR_g34278 [Chara braunii]|eukprot:GBG62906.1 hypothetical protein CBR_g34278 [Chara braunii]
MVETSDGAPVCRKRLRPALSGCGVDGLKFDDPLTGNVILHVCAESGINCDLHVHKEALQRSKFFAARLSDRWGEGGGAITRLFVHCKDAEAYIQTLRLLYAKDFNGIFKSVQGALAILEVAAELLYDECVAACIRYLEAVPWTEEEEAMVVEAMGRLQIDGADDVLARLRPVSERSVEDMLEGLVHVATHSPQQNGPAVKAFVAKILSDYASRECVRAVLEKAFNSSLKSIKDGVEEYSTPVVRRRHDDIEALQKQGLHMAVVTGRHLLWIVERMIELRVADNAVVMWSVQAQFTENLVRAFSEDAVRSSAPGLPSLVLRCTCRFSGAIANGDIPAPRDVRANLVRHWLPVIIVSKRDEQMYKSLFLEVEQIFLRIILTLPMGVSQELLPQCLNFATRTHMNCPHLAATFNTWFRRASGVPMSSSMPAFSTPSSSRPAFPTLSRATSPGRVAQSAVNDDAEDPAVEHVLVDQGVSGGRSG